jgi:hypothetical protein
MSCRSWSSLWLLRLSVTMSARSAACVFCRAVLMLPLPPLPPPPLLSLLPRKFAPARPARCRQICASWRPGHGQQGSVINGAIFVA